MLTIKDTVGWNVVVMDTSRQEIFIYHTVALQEKNMELYILLV